MAVMVAGPHHPFEGSQHDTDRLRGAVARHLHRSPRGHNRQPPAPRQPRHLPSSSPLRGITTGRRQRDPGGSMPSSSTLQGATPSQRCLHGEHPHRPSEGSQPAHPHWEHVDTDRSLSPLRGVTTSGAVRVGGHGQPVHMDPSRRHNVERLPMPRLVRPSSSPSEGSQPSEDRRPERGCPPATPTIAAQTDCFPCTRG